MNRTYITLAALSVMPCVAAVGLAAPVELSPGVTLEVEYSAGSGPDTSYMVVDFGNNGGGTYAFAYHYDASQTVTGQDAWLELVNGGGLEWEVSDFGVPNEPNLFVNRFQYQGDEEAPDFGATGQSWAYFSGDYDALLGQVAWSDAQVGMRDRVLTAESFDGWRVSAYDPVTFVPTSQPQAPIDQIPEPASTWCITLVLLGWCGTQARRR